jgi:hypothetical protein
MREEKERECNENNILLMFISWPSSDHTAEK